MVPAPGLLPDLVPGPLHIYAYALHGELQFAWRRFEVRDGVETGLIPSGLQPASVKAIAAG
jgi:hypothetical protein